ncbi:MAG TPA: glycosyltransferase family 9 protein, partial [Daejeonella sp.]
KSNAARLAIIHPGATDLRRRWPAENFGHIADHLIEQNFLVCLTGTASETKTVARVLEHSRRQSHILNFCGRLNLKGLTGLLSMADILVSNDTGPLHLARALQTRTIGIFWCGNSITGMSMTSNIHRSLISWVFQCPLCGLSFKEFEKERSAGCTHCTSFVSDISIDEVKASLQDIIDLGKKKNRASALENERVVR